MSIDAVVDSHLIPFGVLGNVTTAYWLDFLKPKLVGADIYSPPLLPSSPPSLLPSSPSLPLLPSFPPFPLSHLFEISQRITSIARKTERRIELTSDIVSRAPPLPLFFSLSFRSSASLWPN